MKRKKASKSSGAGPSAGPDIEQIEQLLKTMSEHNLEEFEYSRGELRIRLKKPSAGALVAAQRTAAMPEIIVAGTSPVASTGAAVAVFGPRSTEDRHVVQSPAMGTVFY